MPWEDGPLDLCIQRQEIKWDKLSKTHQYVRKLATPLLERKPNRRPAADSMIARLSSTWKCTYFSAGNSGGPTSWGQKVSHSDAIPCGQEVCNMAEERLAVRCNNVTESRGKMNFLRCFLWCWGWKPFKKNWMECFDHLREWIVVRCSLRGGRKVSHQSKRPAGSAGRTGPAGPPCHRSSILPLLLFFPSFPYHCLGNPTSGPFFFWCVRVIHWHTCYAKGPAGMRFVQRNSPREGYTEGTRNGSTKHFEPLLVFCPSWSHLLSSPSWPHFPFMTFSAQHIQSERKTNYIRETGSGLRRFFIGYVKEPTRNSTRL